MCILQIIIRKSTNKYGYIWWNGFGVYKDIEILVQKYKENRKSPNLFQENVGKSPNLFQENVGKSPNLYYKTPLEYIIYRNVTFRYDIEQVSPISCRQDTGAGLEGHHPCGCSL